MKRYLYLFSVTSAIVIGIIFAPQILLVRKAVPVNMSKIVPSKAESTVICSGKIEYSDVNDVRADSPSIIEKINVNIGDIVNEGDVILIRSGAIQKPDSQKNFKNIPDINNFSSIYDAYDNLTNSKSIYVSDGKLEDIKSPYSGVISSISVQEKDSAEEGKSLFTVASKNKMQIKAPVHEARINDVKKGDPVIISGLGFKNSEYRGVVNKISSEARQTISPTGQETVVDVTVLINDVTNDIKPGFTAKCKIITNQEDGLIIIPYESIKTDKRGRDYVYVSYNDVATKKFVETGREFENGVEIISGIEFEDQVITNIDKIFNGERVTKFKNGEDENNV